MSCPNCGFTVDPGARFCPNCGAPQPSEGAGAEFRQLTVLFADLVGSTALAQRLDPETYREVISDYHRICSSHVESFGGYVGQLLGDGVLCYFGYPIAHEEDAEAAVRAAIAIQASLPEYESPAGHDIEARIGIHTGRVVIGDQAGSRQDILALGDATNVAARVQGAAEPGTVLITDETLRLVAGLFVTTSMGLHQMKGIEGQMELHRVERASGVRSRLEIATDLAPLSGRTEELNELMALWAAARRGEGRVIGVEGEAGVGKSRLVHEFLGRIAADNYTLLGGQCSPFRTASAFYPIVEMITTGLGLDKAESTSSALEKLEKGLSIPGIELADVLPYVLTVLGMPASPRYPTQDLSPELRREKTFEALRTMLEALGDLQPLVVSVEDVHWADRSTLDYLGYLAERAGDMSALIVLTWRPAGTPDLAQESSVMKLSVVLRLSK